MGMELGSSREGAFEPVNPAVNTEDSVLLERMGDARTRELAGFAGVFVPQGNEQGGAVGVAELYT
jgi:hypothetical protein